MEKNDFNDIESRLKRILFAVNSRIDNDYKRHIKTTPLGEGVQIDLPAVDDPMKIKNDILSILHHLATIKDHLKQYFENNGIDKKIIENTINSSFHLQILIDLVNADKHGYPTKTNRSGKNPIIKNFSQILKNNNDGKYVIATIGEKGEFDIVDGKPPSVVLNANIYDDHGNLLMGFNELVEVCCEKWLSMAQTNV